MSNKSAVKTEYTKFNDDTVKNLCDAIERGKTLKQAAEYAQVSETNLHNKLRTDANIREKVQGAKRKYNQILAEQNITRRLKDNDKDITKFVLERTMPEIYAPKQQINVNKMSGKWVIKEGNNKEIIDVQATTSSTPKPISTKSVKSRSKRVT